VKFLDTFGVVSIRLYRNAFDCVILKVADGGCGIAPENIGKLSVAFGHSCRWSSGEEGTGLDVSIVTKLVELHGWRSCDLGEQALNWSKWP